MARLMPRIAALVIGLGLFALGVRFLLDDAPADSLVALGSAVPFLVLAKGPGGEGT
jgi:hypothetical protein